MKPTKPKEPAIAEKLRAAKHAEEFFPGWEADAGIEFSDWLAMQVDELTEQVGKSAELMRLVGLWAIAASVKHQRGRFGVAVPPGGWTVDFPNIGTFKFKNIHDAKGSKSRIYIGHDVEHPDCKRAIKVGNTSASQPEMRNEALMLNRIKHIGRIPRVYWNGVLNDKGRMGTLMNDLTTHFSLEELRVALGGSISLDDSLWIFKEVFALLADIRALGIVHCALSPQNILVAPASRTIRIVGWGNSCMAGQTASQALDERFLPPEIAKRQTVSEATDLYTVAASIIHSSGGTSNELTGMPDYYPQELCVLMQTCFLAKTRRVQAAEFWKVFSKIVNDQTETKNKK